MKYRLMYLQSQTVPTDQCCKVRIKIQAIFTADGESGRERETERENMIYIFGLAE